MLTKIYEGVIKNVVFIAWAIALVASLTSLALSEIWQLEPCKLCWYQRGFMFSLVFVLGVAEKYKDDLAYRYALPLSIVGGLIAFYHSLLQWGFLKEPDLLCSAVNSCAIAKFEWLGFINIPFLSLLGFLAISCLMLLQLKYSKK